MFDLRSVVCVFFGLLLSVVIWVAVPYNNFAVNNSFISDSYLPEVVVLAMVIIVLAVNPLLRRFLPGAALQRQHLTILCGMMLFAAIIPSNGLMRFFPHSLAMNTQLINQSPLVAPAVADSPLPPSLFPDPIGHDVETPVVDQFNDELDHDASIPWRAWLPVWLSWGTLITAFWVLMIGMGLMVYRQWVSVERLAFPLLRVYHALIDDAEEGKAFPPVFRSRLFWVGCGTVLVIHSITGASIFSQGAVPEFPVSWNLSAYLTEGIWQYTPGFLKSTRIYFLFVGLAFFMPNRYSFSIWFTILVVGLFIVYARSQMPTFQPSRFYDQGAGAIIAMAGGVIWLGRWHYARVFMAAIGRAPGIEPAEERTDALAGRMFIFGLVVMFAWYLWVGVGPLWAAFFVATAVIIMLIVTRIVAETGITYIWIIPLTAKGIVAMLPGNWSTVASAYMQEAHYIIANRASAVSAAAVTVLALGLNPGATAESRRRWAGLGLAVLVLGLFVGGAVHLDMGYTMATSLDGANTPVAGRGAQMMPLGDLANVVAADAADADRSAGADFERLGWVGWGVLLGGVLLFLCARFPAWPLHPIGLIFVYSSIGLRLFMSLFIGWLIKVMLVRLVGATAYKTAMPLFLGLIVGEILANAIWILAPVLQLLFGVDPNDIDRMPIFRYT